MYLTWASRSCRVALLLAIVWLIPLLVQPAQVQAAPHQVQATTQVINITADGTFQLAAGASFVPHSFSQFKRFGLYDSAPISFTTLFTHAVVRYQRALPALSTATVDLRAQDTNGRWSEWQTDVADGSVVAFDGQMRAVQYRVRLMSQGAASPQISRIAIEPQSHASASYSTASKQIAPTYRLRVTRQGMVGGTTANGHVIKENDFFVSLPSGRALASLGGHEYQVRLSANGRSVVVPVWDNGPWNHHDDFWNKDRERYPGLPLGWPQDHAAYYEGHNGGKAERGTVRFPSAVDIADGAYYALGLDGAQATVDVTFLWLGSDPGPHPKPLNQHPSKRPAAQQISQPEPTPEPAPDATPQPTPEPAPQAPSEPVVEIDDAQPQFRAEGPNWDSQTGSCTFAGQAHWTTTTKDDATDQAVWRPSLAGGTYDVYAYIPACAERDPASSDADYIIQHATDHAVVRIDQAAAAGTWALLGRYSFAAGSKGYVQLRNDSHTSGAPLWFDAVKWVPVAP